MKKSSTFAAAKTKASSLKRMGRERQQDHGFMNAKSQYRQEVVKKG